MYRINSIKGTTSSIGNSTLDEHIILQNTVLLQSKTTLSHQQLYPKRGYYITVHRIYSVKGTICSISNSTLDEHIILQYTVLYSYQRQHCPISNSTLDEHIILQYTVLFLSRQHCPISNSTLDEHIILQYTVLYSYQRQHCPISNSTLDEHIILQYTVLFPSEATLSHQQLYPRRAYYITEYRFIPIKGNIVPSATLP